MVQSRGSGKAFAFEEIYDDHDFAEWRGPDGRLVAIGIDLKTQNAKTIKEKQPDDGCQRAVLYFCRLIGIASDQSCQILQQASGN